MIWSVSGALIALVGPGSVEGWVRAAVAERWNVASESITVDWGRFPAAGATEDSAAIRLLGSGRDGRFVVTFRAQAGREIAVSIRVGYRAEVLVAARPIGTGAIITAADVATIERVRWGGPPPQGPTNPIGLEARRSLGTGDLLEPPAVAPPVAISSGQLIRFVWEQAGIRVVREAIAQNQGRPGETVWGRDPERGDRLVGLVIRPGWAQMTAQGRNR